MCCFAGPVRSVRNTRIFARLSGQGTQFLVYEMEFSSEAENAMILPLPVLTPAAEDAVRFIDFKDNGGFFEALDAGFPVKPSFSLSRSKGASAAVAAAAPLPVEEVGDYVASFVPAMKDFDRLDPRFRIAPEIWAKIPSYADYGFAVFQLKSREGRPHPMAFELKTRMPDKIFFPTVHIHDGEVHPTESFDHALYLQDASFDAVAGDYEDRDAVDWSTGFVRSDRPASAFAAVNESRGVVAADLLVHRRDLRGELPNVDQIHGFAQASIVPQRLVNELERPATRWGLGGGAALIGTAALGWVIARRRKLAKGSA